MQEACNFIDVTKPKLVLFAFCDAVERKQAIVVSSDFVRRILEERNHADKFTCNLQQR